MEIDSTFLIQLFLILSLIGMLSRVLFAPMLALFEAREQKIDGAKQEALLFQQEAAQKLQEVESRIHAAQKESKQALLILQAEGRAYQRATLEAARAEGQKNLKEAQENLKIQISKLRVQLESLTPGFSKQIADQLLGNPGANISMENSHA